MKINKFLVLVFVALVCIIPTTQVFAKVYNGTNTTGKSISINVVSSTLDGRENQTNVSGLKPEVTSNDISVKGINDNIEAIYKENTKNAAQSRAKSVVYSYEVYESKGYLSLVITSKIQNATESQKVNVVNFSTSDGSLTRLSEILAGKPIEIVSNYINKSIKNDSKYDKEVSITDASQFYLSDGNIWLVFDSYTLAQNQTKIVAIDVDLSEITSFKLLASDYYSKDKFNIRMIPLRKTSEGLYYDISWMNLTKTFTVTDDDTSSNGSTNSNTYIINNKKVRLEYKPELQNGILYVPISYFTDILGLSYKIDTNGDLTFFKI